jgi:RNA polymerase sigma-70 factor (ECF subfamily)
MYDESVMDPTRTSDSPCTPPPGDGDEKMVGVLLSDLRSQSQSDQEIFASLQTELRRIARAKMRLERADHTLPPTALVNEAFIRLFRARLAPNLHTDHRLALRIVARAMEEVLNDYADAHKASKRGGAGKKRVPLDEQQRVESAADDRLRRIDRALLVNPDQSEDILLVRDGVRLLAETSPRQAQVIHLQYYGGLTQEEIAAALDVSIETIKLDSRKAKVFLKAYISTRTGVDATRA